MVNKQLKVDVETSKSISRTATTSAWTDYGGNINTLRKWLIRISIAQVLVVAVTTGTLGLLVNANMKEIDALKQKTENLQERLNIFDAQHCCVVRQNQLSENQTKWKELEAKIDISQTSFENDFLELSNNLTEMKAEQTSYQSAVIVIDTRLKQLESVIDDCKSNTTMLQDHDEKIKQIEENIVPIDNSTCTNYSTNITELQNQVSIHETSIAQLGENYQNISDGVQTFGSTIAQIELSRENDKETIKAMNKTIRSSIETLILSVADLERNSTHYNIDVQGLHTRISDIESAGAWNRALTSTLNTSITDLQAELSAQMQDMNARNRSIMHLTESVEMNSHSIQNITDRLSAFDADNKMNYAALEANTEILAQLVLDVNTTMTLLYNLDSDVSYIQVIKSAFTVTDPVEGLETNTARFTNAVTNIGTHYNTSTGVFTCKYPGIYVFTLHILQETTSPYVACHIRKNSQKEGKDATTAQKSLNSGIFSSSTSVILQLARGDIVNVYCGSGLDGINSDFSSFSGFLNKADGLT